MSAIALLPERRSHHADANAAVNRATCRMAVLDTALEARKAGVRNDALKRFVLACRDPEIGIITDDDAIIVLTLLEIRRA